MAEEQVGYVVTNAGQNIIARILTGLNVTFSRIVIGDGYDHNPTNFAMRTELANEVLSLNVESVQITNSKIVELKAKFSKSDISTAFWFREIGVYIVDPDDETNEILFAYGNRNDQAEYITPHVQNHDISKTIKCEISVGSSANVTVIIKDTDGVGKYNFTENDWKLEGYGTPYTLNVGELGDAFKVFLVSGDILKETGMIEIIKDSANNIILKSLTPFDGCVYYL